MAQQTKNQIKSYFEAGDRPNDVEFGHLFDSILFLNELNQGSNTDVTSLAGGLTLGGTLTLTGTTDFKMGGNILIGNLNENLTRPIQAYSSTNETIIFASGSISNVQYEGISGDATASIKLKDNYASTATAVFGTHTGKAFIAVGDNEVFNVSASNAGYNSFFSGSVGIGTASPAYTLDLGEKASTIRLVSEDDGTAIRIGAGGPDNDVTLLRVDGSTTNHDGESDDSSFGFSLKYMGSRSGNENSFSIFSDNQTGTAEEVFSILQDGKIGIGTTSPSTKLHVAGTTANTFIRVQTTTGNANLQGVTDLSNFSWLARGSSNRFDLIDQNAPTTIMKIFGDSSVSETLVLREGKVGIGTDTPAQKLEVEGGHIQLGNGYGLGRGFGTDSLYVFYPFLADADVPNTFVNITPSNSNTGGMSLQADRTISFVETDSNILIGQMELNQKKFDWDGDINAHKVFANEFHGDGSNLTNIVGSQISGFVNNAGDNRIITVVDSSGNAIRGESDFTFDGTDVKLDGNLAIGKGTAGLFTPDAPLHIKHNGDSLGDQDLIHLSMQSGTAEGNISIKFSDAGAPSTQHFKITFGEGDNDLKFHSDSVDNILSLEDDGKVGIGVASGLSSKLTVDGSIRSLEGSIGNLNVGDGKGQQMEFGTDAVTTLRFDADRWRVYTGGGSFEAFTVLENGNIGIGNSAPSQKLHLVSTSDIKIHVKSSKVDGVATTIVENDAHKFEYGLASDDTFRIINRGPNSSPSSTVPVKISPSSIDNLLFVDDSSVVVAGETPFGTSKLTVEGRFTSKAGVDEDYIRFAGPSVTKSDGNTAGVTAGIKRITGQGGIQMFSDSVLVLHAGDRHGEMADKIAAFHDIGDGSPTDCTTEQIHLVSDGAVRIRTQTQEGVDHANIHHYTFTQGALALNSTSLINNTKYKLDVNGGGIAVDSNDNDNYGFIFQGGEGAGIGLLGNDARSGNTRMDLHVEDDGRVTIGNVAPHGNAPLTIKSKQTNTDAINLVSAGTNATRIVQISDTTNGHGLIDIFNNDTTHTARIYGAADSFFLNRLGVGTDSPAKPLHVKSNDDAPLLVESTDTFSGIKLQDSGTTTGFIGPAAYNNTFLIRTDNLDRMKISSTGRIAMGGDPVDNVRLRIVAIGTIASSDIGNAALLIGSTSAGLGMDPNELYFNGHAGNFGTLSAHALAIKTNNSTRIYIASGGFVGIGTGSPSNKLHVKLDSGDVVAQFLGTDNNAYIRIKQDVDVPGAAGILCNNSDTTVSFLGYHDSQLKLTLDSGPSSIHGLRFKNSCLIVGAGGSPDQTYTQVGGTANFGLNLIGNATADANLNTDGGNVAAYRYYLSPHGLEGRTTEDGAVNDGKLFSWVIAQLSNPGVSKLAFYAWRDGVVGNKAFIDYNESGELNFTGQHPCKPVKPISEYQDKIGHIVISTGTIANQPREHLEKDGSRTPIYPDFPLDAPTVDESLPVVKLSEQPNDKRVYGVISQPDDPNTTRRDRKSFAGGFNWLDENRSDDRLIINALGEGAVMVCNINGNLENGDYITTSAVEGLGMKQDDDLLHNYTVAKIIEDCDFTSGTTEIRHNGVTYKTKLVGCTYHCG